MKNLKVIALYSDEIIFDNGMKVYSYHDPDCCESHYLSLCDLSIEDFEGLEFDLSNDDFFERIEDYGIVLKPVNGHPIRIPGYGLNNGYYSSNLSLIITNTDGRSNYKHYDITECQECNGY